MKTIIVADDDEIFRSIVRRHLTEMGFSVIENESGKFVRDQVLRFAPAACIIDLVMDEKEGIETIMELTGLHDRPKIIAVSSNKIYLDDAEILGADAILKKPITPEALKTTFVRLGIEPDGLALQRDS